MTALQMASTLRKQGINVELIFRKEGGARITHINGKTFKGSEGNAEARSMLGQALSQTQQKHLQKNYSYRYNIANAIEALFWYIQ